MSSRLRTFESSVGTKILIGFTGLGLVIYLLTHIAGNALVFLGPDVFNTYAHTLTSNPLIPLIEIGLAVVFLAHIYKTVRMHVSNRQARPVRYEVKKPAGPPSRKTFASSTMILSGLWLLAFVVLHVRAFRFGLEYEAAGGVRDLYRIEMETLSHPATALFYVVSMAIVGSHLWHGVSSAFQSLGLDHPTWTPRVLLAGRIFAVAVAGGFTVIAVWAYFTGARS
jgi:succinate dehydrogenase / fumarate reductase cytochrome b subunit